MAVWTRLKWGLGETRVRAGSEIGKKKEKRHGIDARTLGEGRGASFHLRLLDRALGEESSSKKGERPVLGVMSKRSDLFFSSS